MAMQPKAKADDQVVVDSTQDTPRDRAFSSWLSDVEDYLKKTFGSGIDQVHKERIGGLINHNPSLGWQADPEDCYQRGGMTFEAGEKGNGAVFKGLGPYWSRVRHIGIVIARSGHHRALGTLRFATTTNKDKPDPQAFARMRDAVKAHVDVIIEVKSVERPKYIPRHSDAYEEMVNPLPFDAKERAAGREPEPVDTTDYSEKQP